MAGQPARAAPSTAGKMPVLLPAAAALPARSVGSPICTTVTDPGSVQCSQLWLWPLFSCLTGEGQWRTATGTCSSKHGEGMLINQEVLLFACSDFVHIS